jgi:hypothetical protein
MTPMSRRLVVALALSWLVTTYSAFIDYIGPPAQSVFAGVAKPALFLVLTWFVASGHAWARWLLAVWLLFGVVVALSAFMTVGDRISTPRAVLGVAMTLTLAWAAAELTLSALRTGTKTRPG